MDPFTALKNLSPFHFIFYFLLFFHLSYQPFTSLHFTLLIISTTHFPSLSFTFYFLSPSLPLMVFIFLALVLIISVLPWEVPLAPSGSLFQSVMDLEMNSLPSFLCKILTSQNVFLRVEFYKTANVRLT